MKAGIALAAFAGLVSAAPGDYFGVIATHSGSAVHLQAWSASGEQIWIGKGTSAYCPSEVQNCPKGKYTNFAGGDGSLAMGAEVPGGQQVYIEPTAGLVKYTQAHSADVPAGSKLGGWTLDQGKSEGFLSWKNGLVACSTKGNAQEGPWKIHAQLKGLKFGKECLGIGAVTSNMTKPDAWEYT